MGHLFSRAIKRFTQCSNRNQLPSQEQQETARAGNAAASGSQQHQQHREHNSRPIVQSIPVGQSIDSAEYAAFDSTKSTRSSGGNATKPVEHTAATIIESDQENEGTVEAPAREDGGGKQPQVEEAVIKIQALVRGHLTRKALKDAQQQAATPAPNALGQSQFDEESLTKNPPSAVFLPSSPLNVASISTAAATTTTTTNTTTNTNNDSTNEPITKSGSSQAPSRVPPLASIAEDVETGPQATTAATTSSIYDDSPHLEPSKSTRDNQRRKLSPINRSLAISTESRSDSLSPVPSEANASIDLNCETPASASIDIMDHNIRPIDPIASVLHLKTTETLAREESTTSSSQSPRMIVDPPQPSIDLMANAAAVSLPSSLPTTPPSGMATIQNSHSIDSAEAAAIRIQSAFRGYHTRKHSPYRRRSPGVAASWSSPPRSLDSALSNGHGGVVQQQGNPLRQQGTAMGSEEGEDAEVNERLSHSEHIPTRRASRQRQRLDTDDSQTSNSGQPNSLADDHTAALESASTLDETSNNTCISMVAASSDLSNQTANLTDNIEFQLQSSQQSRNNNDSLEPIQPEDEVKLSIDQNLSLEMDTESSNLGAALSLNEDFSESEVHNQAQGKQHDQLAMQQEGEEEDKSFSANLVTEELNSEAQRLMEQLESDGRDVGALEQLDQATDQLEAALEGATEDVDVGDRMAESLANAILDEDEQRTNEMESDDIERRDPSGHGSFDRSKSPLIKTTDQQPALVSGGNSFEEYGQEEGVADNQKLVVESPDEAIGSGRSSPALISSNGESGSSEDEEGGNKVDEQGLPDASTEQQDNGRSAAGNGGNKSKKKNRNRKKGRKLTRT